MNFSFNSSNIVEPRASVSYTLNPRNTITFSYGLHGQMQPLPVYLYQSVNNGIVDRRNRDLDFSKAVPSTGPAGSISIHHARLVHGSAENVSSDPRRLLLFEYTAADAWPLLGIGTLEEFDSRLLVGQPTIAPRLTDVPVRMPLPPAPFQGSIYENQTTLKNRFFSRKPATVQ